MFGNEVAITLHVWLAKTLTTSSSKNIEMVW